MKMSLFGKKRFGLTEALVVIDKKPDITPDGAKTGAAFVEALGLPVTVVAEAEERIEEINTSLKATEEGINAANTELRIIPMMATTMIDSLKAELKKLVEAIKFTVLGKVDRIEDARDLWISFLEKEIEIAKTEAEVKGNKARARGDKKTAKIEKKIDAKIAEAQAQLKSDLAGIRRQISYLESETKSAKAELSTLSKIKTLFS